MGLGGLKGAVPVRRHAFAWRPLRRASDVASADGYFARRRKPCRLARLPTGTGIFGSVVLGAARPVKG